MVAAATPDLRAVVANHLHAGTHSLAIYLNAPRTAAHPEAFFSVPWPSPPSEGAPTQHAILAHLRYRVACALLGTDRRIQGVTLNAWSPPHVTFTQWRQHLALLRELYTPDQLTMGPDASIEVIDEHGRVSPFFAWSAVDCVEGRPHHDHLIAFDADAQHWAYALHVLLLPSNEP